RHYLQVWHQAGVWQRLHAVLLAEPNHADQINWSRALNRVAPGRYLPGAPTDPYGLALEHTVPQIRGSLRADRASASCARGPRGNAGRGHGIWPRSSSEDGPGG